VDAGGNVYAAGYVSGTGSFDFGGGVAATGACKYSSLVLVRYNSSGVAQWARTVSAASDPSSFDSVAADAAGRVYAVGRINGTASFNFGEGIAVTGPGTYSNPVLVRYDPAGMPQWARTVAAGLLSPSFSSVAVDPDGSVYAIVRIAGTGIFDFGGGVTAKGTTWGSNAVLVKYDPSGVALWARTAP
jgi:hypothetical protein